MYILLSNIISGDFQCSIRISEGLAWMFEEINLSILKDILRHDIRNIQKKIKKAKIKEN